MRGLPFIDEYILPKECFFKNYLNEELDKVIRHIIKLPDGL